jgi:hypothetical protein
VTAWWRRSNTDAKRTTSAKDRHGDEVEQAFEILEPPQVESLFDADTYAVELAAPVAVAEPGLAIETPRADEPVTATADADTGARAGSGFGTRVDTAVEPDVDPADEYDPEPLQRRHVRRRSSGRRRRPGTPERVVRGEETPAEVTSAPEAVGETVQPAKRSHSATVRRARSALAVAGRRALSVLLIIVVLLGSIWGLIVSVNAFARWNARRVAYLSAAPASTTVDNLLVIGVGDGVAIGFTALKAERSSNRVLGIAIPDGAFMEVPGKGFERVGASYLGGPEVSKDAVSNYLGVPFRTYVVVDAATYQTLLTGQNVGGIMAAVTKTDLTAASRAAFTKYFASVKSKDVWIVPLPVKPVAVGDERYFEPQRAQVADLLLQWWGVQATQQTTTPRVIVYNGVGTPGLAGLASQQLIRAGLRVVDSGNADNFTYKTTVIYLYHGTQADAEAVRAALGVGEVIVQSAPQDLTDMIVIVGADYRPPTSDLSSVPTEGVK